MAEFLQNLTQNSFLNHLGFEMVQLDVDSVALKLLVQPDHHNLNQTLHGGVHAAMLESIQTMVIQSIYKTKTSVMNLNVHYLAPVSTGEIMATAKIIQKGYKVAMAEAKIIGEKQQLIATGTGVYKILRDS
ncbi:PaaI family thioesterase [Neobacillus sp. SM06]|uniref:PaaI family thioesterase n=1 Tax=Neobacillus sp. SM06 TaxID=3422492 RepID=UPI003D2BB5DE